MTPSCTCRTKLQEREHLLNVVNTVFKYHTQAITTVVEGKTEVSIPTIQDTIQRHSYSQTLSFPPLPKENLPDIIVGTNVKEVSIQEVKNKKIK